MTIKFEELEKITQKHFEKEFKKSFLEPNPIVDMMLKNYKKPTLWQKIKRFFRRKK